MKSTPDFRKPNLVFAVLVVTFIAGVVRFLPVIGTDFPLNGGGLFTQMAQDLIRNGFFLPAATTYNGESIPFAYPPMGLYLTAILSQLPGASPTEVLRLLPAALSTMTVPAFYLLAARLLRSPWRGAIAAASLALMPNAYMWLIAGGGITRALGLLLALLALNEGVELLRTQSHAKIMTTAILSGLTFLAHPQAAVFVAVSLAVLLAFHVIRDAPRSAAGHLGFAAMGAVAIASPWVIAVVSTHGWQPMFSASQTGIDLGAGFSSLVGLGFVDAPVLDIVTALGVFGLVLRVARRQWMIPTWLVLTVLVDPRAGAVYATIPLALSVVPVLNGLIKGMAGGAENDDVLDTTAIPVLVWRRPATAVLLALLLFVGLRTNARTAIDPATPLHGLEARHVAAMTWVAEHASVTTTFAAVSNRSWERDYISEWFPVLAHHSSVATVQGTEWSGRDVFVGRIAMYRQLQECAVETVTCLESWVRRWDVGSVAIFVPKGQLYGPASPKDCCPSLRQSLRTSSDYVIVYDGPGATIFAAQGSELASSTTGSR